MEQARLQIDQNQCQRLSGYYGFQSVGELAASAEQADCSLSSNSRPTLGKTVFNICLACHAIGPGAQNKIGPELNGLDGRKAGTVPNFDYSDANKNSGIVWSEATFEDYIKNPAAKVPDTKMIFPGIKNEQQAKDLWAYISQFDADGNSKK